MRFLVKMGTDAILPPDFTVLAEIAEYGLRCNVYRTGPTFDLIEDAVLYILKEAKECDWYAIWDCMLHEAVDLSKVGGNRIESLRQYYHDALKRAICVVA